MDRKALIDLADRLFPPGDGCTPAQLARHRFGVATVLVTILTTAGITPVYWSSNPALGQVLGAYCALLIGVAVVYRVSRSTELLFWCMESLTALYFLFSSWTESTFDFSWAMWLVILPLVGMLFGGVRYAVIGLCFGLVTALVIVLGPVPALFERGPVTHATVVGRVLSFFFVAFVLSSTSEWLRLEALRRAERAARARTTFLANMSHELRTPMNGVLGFTDLLLESSPRADQVEYLELMRRSGQQLLAIINDIVDFSRLDAQRLQLHLTPVDLRALVSDVVELLQPAARHGKTSLTLSIAGDVPTWIMTDEVRLRQVVTNVAGNAVKFAPGATVAVSVAREGALLRVDVRDTGIGIAPEVQARLFKPFEQAEASASRRFGGSGLGLSISRELMGLLGGGITLESELGKGSTFTLSWPCVEAAPQSSDSAVAAAREVPPGFRVLVVDDNPVNLRLAAALLRKLGAEATEARDGAQAVEAVAREPFDVVLMDCHMPDVDGFEATRRIRRLENQRAAGVPIFALTASALREELQRCVDVGMNDWLTKPVTLRALSDALSSVASATGARGVGEAGASQR